MKGLFDGYDNNFVEAIHVLMPQIENLVRYHMKLAGLKTTTIDQDGIEIEIGLCSLTSNKYKEEVEEIFGENLTFEINALLCSNYGPNLRNNIAHGLMNFNECHSNNSVYFWWFVLKIVFNNFISETEKIKKINEIIKEDEK